ncbi:MAG: DUF4292 domain-containing protein [Flavobacteriaceae bacterium]
MRRLMFLIMGLLVLSSCGNLKNIGSSGALESMSTKTLAKKNEGTLPENKMINARMTLRYESEEQLQNLVVKLRMQQDSVIWMSASVLGIQVAKIMITPNRVQFYEKLGKSYYDGDFSAVEQFIGIKVNFSDLQRLLMGMPVRPLTDMKLSQVSDSTHYVLEPKLKFDDLRLRMKLNPGDYRLSSQEVFNFNTGEIVANIGYQGLLKVAQSLWPKTISFQSEKAKITIEYKRIEDKKRQTYPYRVPAKYRKFNF